MPSRLVPELHCSSYERSIAFYRDALGFTPYHERPEEGFVFLDRDGAQIMIRQPSEGDTDTLVYMTAPPEYPHGRGLHLVVLTDRIDTLYKQVMAAAPAAVKVPIENKWYRVDEALLGNRQFVVEDPDGNLLRFYEELEELEDA